MKSIVYLGTPQEAVPPLRALHEAGYSIVLVVTRADARRGRRGEPSPSPVKAAALELGLRVEHSLDGIRASGAEMGIVVAYGRIIPAHLLQQVPMLNIHFSRLPRWRGAAPVERAILAGDTETAVSIMQMEAGLDTGPVHAEQIVPITIDDTAESLRDRLVATGTDLLLDTLQKGLTAPPTPQVGEAVYAHKITSEDRRIDWRAPTRAIDAQIRIGRAHTTTFDGERFIIWRAQPVVSVDKPVGQLFLHEGAPAVGTIDGALALIEVQPAGKPRMAAQAWWRGARPAGTSLGDTAVEGTG